MGVNIISEERKFRIKQQKIDLSVSDCQGRVLDIGGGGEGVIGQLLGDGVVVIDPNLKELEEAPAGPLKIVMDARQLKFLDSTFDAVTSFFTMMYINMEDHKKVVEEIYRVLKPGGQFILWDITIPEYPGGDKDVFVFPLEIDIKYKKINTGYGTLWPGRKQDINYFMDVCRAVGFVPLKNENMGEAYCLEFIKQ